MQENRFLRVNRPKVINETIEGETIIVNLETGRYYSTEGAGSDIWGTLSANGGLTVQTLLEEALMRYSASPDEIREGVLPFVDLLEKEALVIREEKAQETSSSPQTQAQKMPKKAFQKPALQKYTDMQDLLLLDPIHEVDETGWPNAK